MTREADQLDQVTELQEAMNQKGLAEVRKSLARQSHPDFDGKSCVDCGDDIQPSRLVSGRIRCTLCESVLEQRSKLFR